MGIRGNINGTVSFTGQSVDTTNLDTALHGEYCAFVLLCLCFMSYVYLYVCGYVPHVMCMCFVHEYAVCVSRGLCYVCMCSVVSIVLVVYKVCEIS